MIQLIAGLLAPTRGRVLQDGVDINGRGFDKNELYGKIGLVFQFPGYQLFETTVEKDVAFGLKHSGLGRDETAERVRWALETVGFSYDAIRTQSPLALSGGEKRRVAIAGILASKPKVLIFDEPTAGLDPAGQEALYGSLPRSIWPEPPSSWYRITPTAWAKPRNGFWYWKTAAW
jgi:energy-coupling factor transport system ATP-binding protein